MSLERENINGLKEQADLLQRKLNLIRKKRPLEDDPTRMLKLEVDEEETVFQLAQVKKELAEALAEIGEAPIGSQEEKQNLLHDHHRYTCNRIKQDVRFHKVFKNTTNDKAHFFYLYGMNVQSHKGLFYRFAFALEGKLLDYLNPDFESKCKTITALPTFDLAQDEEYDKEQILSSLFASLNVSYDKFEPLLEKDLTYLYQNSPLVADLCEQDYVCILLGISSYDWDVELIPEIARWFITKFCASQLPDDAPTFLFFFGIIFEDEDEAIHNEVKEIVKNSNLIYGLPELNEVTKRDIESWFAKYNFITKTIKEREDIIQSSFGDSTSFDMEEVELKLKKIIDEYNQS